MDNEIFKVILLIAAKSAFPAVLFVIGTSCSFADVFQELKRPLMVLRIFVITSILMPVVTMIVLKIIPVGIDLMGVMLISSATGGSVFALTGTRSKKGNLNLATAAMVILSLIMPLVCPLWLYAFDGLFHLELAASPYTIFIELIPLTIIPLFAGLLFRHFFEKSYKSIQTVVNWYSRVALLILVAVLLPEAVKTIIGKFDFISIAVIFIITTISLFLGYYSFQRTDRKDNITSALTATQTNFSAWILIIHISYPKVHILGIAVAYIVIRMVVVAVWYQYFKIKEARRLKKVEAGSKK